MTDANELYETIMRELNNVVISDTGEINEEQESFSFHEDTVSDDIFPPSLLSYFETSKSRAAVCEKLILEEAEDFTASHHTEDMMNLPVEPDKDMVKLNKQVSCETENEEYNSSADTRLPPAPAQTGALFTHNVTVCPNNEDEAETDEYMGSEKYLEFEVRTLQSAMEEEEIKKGSEYQREKGEQRNQRERDFQEELKKILEAEKLHQRELELMEKRAQEKLEQEFLLQQELISNLQKRVQEERMMREEELQRIKEERERKRKEEQEEKRKREEKELQRIKEDQERKRKEEQEEKRKREEKELQRIKEEQERKRKEEQEEKRKREEEEDRRKREEEKIKREMERRRMEEEMRRKEEEKRRIEEMRLIEKHRRKKEEEQRKKEEEEKWRVEEEKKKREEEKNKIEEDMRMKEEERKIKEIRLKDEEMRRQLEEEERQRKKKEEEEKTIEVARMKMEEDKRRQNEEEIGVKEEGRNSGDEDKRREEEVRMKQEEIKKEEERKREEETRKVEKEMVVKQMKRKEEEKREKEEIQVKEDEEKRKKDEERRYIVECKDTKRKKTKEEKRRKCQEEEMKQQIKIEEDYSNKSEEIRLKKEKEWNKAERISEDKEKRLEEMKTQEEKDDMRQMEDGRRNTEAGKKQIKRDARKNKDENMKTEERELREEEQSNKAVEQDTEVEKRPMRADELQEKQRGNDGMKTQNESKNTENARDSLISQLEDGTVPTSSSPGPSHSESTARPTSFETVQQHDPNKDTSKPCASSGSLPACLPEHTEQKRLSWMKDCIPWSKLSLQNRRRQEGCVRSRRGPRRAAEASSLPPLCPHTLLQSTGCRSLQEITTVTLEDLPGCSLSTLAQCTHLQSLTLRRCGLKSLEGINQLPQLCYVDVQENDISFVDCENMASLRVLRLGRNKLTSIHGLSGAENVDVLDLSHNSITRIAGLESMRSLQRLSVDHNQLISTRGLRDVYTLLHLDCSHNHLASVEGLENSALLQTLDLRANSLTEPPSLNNHILLRELHLDDNSISSLQGLVVCWLPLMHHLSVGQNRITLLPSMCDFVSLANLDLRFNCMSELQSVCESLEGCQFLREVHLSGNPLQQESGWRSTLQKAVANLRAIDGQETDSFLLAPAVQEVSLASGSFLMFCQAQLKQTRDLQQQHSRELSNASSHLDAVKSSCRHFAETLKLAVDQRFAHEYGDSTVSEGQTAPEKTLHVDATNAEMFSEHTEMCESTVDVPPVIPNRNNISCSYWTLEEKSSAESFTTGLPSLATKGKSSSHLETEPGSDHQNPDPKNTAAVVIQQRWRKYRQKCGNISSPPTAEKGGGRGGDGGKPESGPSYINGSVAGQDHAATTIQALWRGFSLRRRLASALAAVTCPESGEDESFEEVDVDEFVFDEAALEKHWTLPLSEDSPSRRRPVSEQPLSLKLPGPSREPSQYTLPPPPLWRPKQAWVAGEQVESVAGQRISPESSSRSKSPASTSALSGISARSEKILEEWGFTDSHTALLMLRRAQKMKSKKKQQQKKHRDPSVRLALFRNCNYQRGPVEARNRPAPHSRNYMKVCEAELGLRQAEKTEQVKQERSQQWLHAQSDRHPESEHFLPEISSDILNGGRVQLVADPGYTERLHHASGLWANSSVAAQPSKERNYPRRNSLGHARKEAPSPQRVTTSASLKKERISFRDNAVQLSGGWGGGKKRDKVYK